ncbi:complement resistance protein TraT [Ruminobacter sp. RM87]|uniref:complement resistance protein TraT n=1 Tax=Ruminobacter sp. RM87 TaxID=1200567 RepID=UPI0004E0BC14|nr:complement resistance protein TraT [Ruminobacter sp. RM87]
MKNIAKCLAMGTVLAFGCMTATTGCTSSGQHLSKYRDLNIRMNYSNTFHLQPASRIPETVYVNLRDLSGSGLDSVFSSKLIPRISSQPNMAITYSAADADIIIYGTISSADSTSNGSTGGVVAGTVIGAATGGVIAATNNYHPGLSILPIILGLVGAGVGYAIDDSNSIDTLMYSADIEVRQKNGLRDYDTYQTTITVSGQQLNMNKMQATNQMFEHVSEGLSQLISH